MKPYSQYVCSSMDHYIIILAVTLSLITLDQSGAWEHGVLVILGRDSFTHHFLATFLIINGLFFSVGLFLTSFDLRNIRQSDTNTVPIT